MFGRMERGAVVMAWSQRPQVVGRAQLQRRVEKARGASAAEQPLLPTVKEAGRMGRGGQARFRAAAFSVLSPANREFMDAQEAAAAEGPREERKIILGGETFKVWLAQSNFHFYTLSTSLSKLYTKYGHSGTDTMGRYQNAGAGTGTLDIKVQSQVEHLPAHPKLIQVGAG